VARLNSLQVWAADLAAAARFYGQFIGLDLDDEPHTHDGNDAPHYDLAWGDFDSGVAPCRCFAPNPAARG
jgi:hypothetical protein